MSDGPGYAGNEWVLAMVWDSWQLRHVTTTITVGHSIRHPGVLFPLFYLLRFKIVFTLPYINEMICISSSIIWKQIFVVSVNKPSATFTLNQLHFCSFNQCTISLLPAAGLYPWQTAKIREDTVECSTMNGRRETGRWPALEQFNSDKGRGSVQKK